MTRLMWTIWTSLSAVRERPLNLITHSLRPHAPTNQSICVYWNPIPHTYRCHGSLLPPANIFLDQRLLHPPAIPFLSGHPFCHSHTISVPSLSPLCLPPSSPLTVSLCLPSEPPLFSPSSFLPITLCPETCIPSPLLPYLSISTRNSTIAPFCLSLQPPLNPNHSATCSFSLFPAHCPHLSFPHISLSVPATLSLIGSCKVLLIVGLCISAL